MKKKIAPKGEKYALLQDGGLVKGYPWRIWVIIGTPHPACRRRRLGGAGPSNLGHLSLLTCYVMHCVRYHNTYNIVHVQFAVKITPTWHL